MKYYAGLFAGFILLIAFVSSPLAYDTLSHKLERKGPVNEPVIKLDVRNASQMIGQRGIVMGTCRQLKGQALVLEGVDNRSYELPDGVYESKQGFRIHIRMGGIEQVTLSPKMMR